MAEKKKRYVVTHRGLHRGSGKHRREAAIGSTLELTEKDAAGLKGKIALESEHNRPKASNTQLRDANKKIDELTVEIEALKVTISEREDVIDKQAAEIEALTTPPAA